MGCKRWQPCGRRGRRQMFCSAPAEAIRPSDTDGWSVLTRQHGVQIEGIEQGAGGLEWGCLSGFSDVSAGREDNNFGFDSPRLHIRKAPPTCGNADRRGFCMARRSVGEWVGGAARGHWSHCPQTTMPPSSLIALLLRGATARRRDRRTLAGSRHCPPAGST